MTITSYSRRTAVAAVATAASAALLLSACAESSDGSSTASSASSAASSAASSVSAAASASASSTAEPGHEGHDHEHGGETIGTGDVTLTDGYITAKPAEKKMTSFMGELSNKSDKDIVITEVSGNIEGAKFEIHMVKDGVMMVKPDGITIPAKSMAVLKPGSDHIMIMGVSKELAAGDTFDITLTDASGNKYELPKVPVRVQQSTHEHYAK